MSEQLLAFDYPTTRSTNMATISNYADSGFNKIKFTNGHSVHLKDEELEEIMALMEVKSEPVVEPAFLTIPCRLSDYLFSYDAETKQSVLTLYGDMLDFVEQYYKKKVECILETEATLQDIEKHLMAWVYDD